MPVHDDLGTRMKTFYEQVPKTRLMRKMPVIIRIDGKAFHTFTKGFKRPFDEVLIKTMQETTKYLCENIQGCVLGYTQSDEISLVLVDYQRFETSAWFDYEIQKMCSIAASMATMAFNKLFKENIDEWVEEILSTNYLFRTSEKTLSNNLSLRERYCTAINKGAMFDARVFNIPKEEVTNYIYWRQLDATRNSIQMVGQANFNHNELQGKSCNQIQDMLMSQKGINWNDLFTYQKRGSCCVKTNYFISNGKDKEIKLPEKCSLYIKNGVWRKRWTIDKNIPIFKEEGRKYIEKLI